MSDEKQRIRIAAGSISEQLSIFPKSSTLENLLEVLASSWFAFGFDKNERRQTLTLHTVAPALRSGRGLKHRATNRPSVVPRVAPALRGRRMWDVVVAGITLLFGRRQ